MDYATSVPMFLFRLRHVQPAVAGRAYVPLRGNLDHQILSVPQDQHHERSLVPVQSARFLLAKPHELHLNVRGQQPKICCLSAVRRGYLPPLPFFSFQLDLAGH